MSIEYCKHGWDTRNLGPCVECVSDFKDAQIQRLTEELAGLKARNVELNDLYLEIDQLVYELTGNEGEDDSLEVLERFVNSLKSRLAVAEKAVEWVLRHGVHIGHNITNRPAGTCTCGLSELKATLKQLEKGEK
jgi:hypothetical protein